VLFGVGKDLRQLSGEERLLIACEFDSRERGDALYFLDGQGWHGWRNRTTVDVNQVACAAVGGDVRAWRVSRRGYDASMGDVRRGAARNLVAPGPLPRVITFTARVSSEAD
jgi:hypothetical protein